MIGKVVCSLAGRDKGRLMVIVGTRGEGLLVCDGKERPLERPKLKNPKHLKFTNVLLDENRFKTNRALKKELKLLLGVHE